ncbi:hypothetical protein GEMRC1_006720 [Eukaryota sp. GEM-RC1]
MNVHHQDEVDEIEDLEDLSSTQHRPGINSSEFFQSWSPPSVEDVEAYVAQLELSSDFPKWSEWLHYLEDSHPDLPHERSPVDPGYVSPRLYYYPSPADLISTPFLLESKPAQKPHEERKSDTEPSTSLSQLTESLQNLSLPSLFCWENRLVDSRTSSLNAFTSTHPNFPSNLANLLPSRQRDHSWSNFIVPSPSTPPKPSRLVVDLNDTSLLIAKVEDKRLLSTSAFREDEEAAKRDDEVPVELDSYPPHRISTFDSLQRVMVKLWCTILSLQ